MSDAQADICEVDDCQEKGLERVYGIACQKHHKEFREWEGDLYAGRYAAKMPDSAQLEMKGDVDPGAFLMGYLDGLDGES